MVSISEIKTTLDNRLAEITSELSTLVNQPSGSRDANDINTCADLLAEMGSTKFGVDPDRRVVEGVPHLVWTFGRPRVLIACHYDTVWPAGTVERWPFSIDGDKATGPGVFDMKAGIIEALNALACIDRDGVVLALTGDEEVGSITSRALIEELASQCDAALILEPAHKGGVDIGRKGVSFYTAEIKGRAAHAGVEPQNGISALEELAHKVLELREFDDIANGNTVNPTLAKAGTTNNVIPAYATLEIDARATDEVAQIDIDKKIRALQPTIPGTTFEIVGGGINRPPFKTDSSAALFDLAKQLFSDISNAELSGHVVGGGSDGNFTAAAGVPTLDGLGADGAGAHAEGEWIRLSSISERASLVGALAQEIIRRS